MNVRVLYVEDEPSLAQIVSESLVSRGYDVTVATDGKSALEIYQNDAFDICVLDIMLPKMNGYELAEKISETSPNIPIIFLSAKTQTKDVLKGFEVGGRDYLKKPFSMEELIARINNLLQLVPSQKPSSDQYSFGQWMFYPERYELAHKDQVNTLSERESRILHLLCENINTTCYRKEILLSVWGDDSFYNSRNLDVYINKLRKLFRSDQTIDLMTVKGVGYVFKVG